MLNRTVDLYWTVDDVFEERHIRGVLTKHLYKGNILTLKVETFGKEIEVCLGKILDVNGDEHFGVILTNIGSYEYLVIPKKYEGNKVDHKT